MNLDTDFLQNYVKFLNTAFPASLNAEGTIGHADIMVYGLAARLCSLIGTKLDFLDFLPKEGPGDGGPDHKPRADHGPSGGGGPHLVFHGPSGGGGPHLQMLISYATDVSTPELASAYRNANRAG